jgi:addiction module HigA family antidote
MSLLKLRPIHPGEILREQLEELGLSARALAAKLEVPTNRVTGILNETRSVTPDTALRLAKFFGGARDGAVLWLNLQQAHDLRVAEIAAEKDGYLRRITPFGTRHARGARKTRVGSAA